MVDWIKWEGGNSGPPDIEGLRCDMMCRDGTIFGNENSYDWWRDWNWEHGSSRREDIVAYRKSSGYNDES